MSVLFLWPANPLDGVSIPPERWIAMARAAGYTVTDTLRDGVQLVIRDAPESSRALPPSRVAILKQAVREGVPRRSYRQFYDILRNQIGRSHPELFEHPQSTPAQSTPAPNPPASSTEPRAAIPVGLGSHAGHPCLQPMEVCFVWPAGRLDGRLVPREEWVRMASRAGITVSTRMGPQTSYLVVNVLNHSAPHPPAIVEALRHAAMLGVQVITYAHFASLSDQRGRERTAAVQAAARAEADRRRAEREEHNAEVRAMIRQAVTPQTTPRESSGITSVQGLRMTGMAVREAMRNGESINDMVRRTGVDAETLRRFARLAAEASSALDPVPEPAPTPAPTSAPVLRTRRLDLD